MTADPTPTPEQPRTDSIEDATVRLLDLLPGTLGTDRAINRAVDDLVAAAQARPEQDEAVRLRAALEKIARPIAGGYGGDPYDREALVSWMVRVARAALNLDRRGEALATPPPVPAALDVERLSEDDWRTIVAVLDTEGFDNLARRAAEYARLSHQSEDA